MTDTLKLRALMLEKGYTQERLANEAKLSVPALNQKINNKYEFKASEIAIISRILGIKDKESIFFAHDVDLKSTPVMKGR
ncbi:MAG: helix-turn-helix transcriptional regulator [Raoultibacter sp.]